jgi:hypothetical protein
LNNGLMIAISTTGDNIDSKANARLIAAAPEMLEAMIWFVRRVRNGEVHSKRTYTLYVEIIEKATGLTIEEVLA